MWVESRELSSPKEKTYLLCITLSWSNKLLSALVTILTEGDILENAISTMMLCVQIKQLLEHLLASNNCMLLFQV